jgi:CxxC motif-containing protein
MSEVTHYLCIGCPLGCRLEVEAVDGDLEVRGHGCRRGQAFAAQEHTDPRRFVTTTVAVAGGVLARAPVKTAGAVPKALVRDVCRALHGITVPAPVRLGDVVLADVLGTGVDTVATRDVAADVSRDAVDATNRGAWGSLRRGA